MTHFTDVRLKLKSLIQKMPIMTNIKLLYYNKTFIIYTRTHLLPLFQVIETNIILRVSNSSSDFDLYFDQKLD